MMTADGHAVPTARGSLQHRIFSARKRTLLWVNVRA
jgi:hypothetical protein